MKRDRSVKRNSFVRRLRWIGLLQWYSRSALSPVTFAAIIVLIWQFVIARYGFPGIPVRYLGSPAGIWDAFIRLARDGYSGHSLWAQIGTSMARVFVGFAIGAVVGVPLGLIMGYYTAVGNLIGPVLNFLRPIPALAFIPVVTIWFGTTETAMVLVIAATGFLYIVIGSWSGVRSVPRDYLRAAANYNVTGWRLLSRVVLPPAFPQIMTSLRTGMALCWAVVVAAELIAAQEGLGFMIENASTFFDINVVYVGITFIGVVGILIEVGFHFMESRLLHWVGQ